MSKRDIIFFSLMVTASVWTMSLEYFQHRMEKRCAAAGTAYSRRFRVMGFAGALVIMAAAVFVRFWLFEH